MSAQDKEPGDETASEHLSPDPDPQAEVVDPTVIDLREGVDTIAVYEAEQERRAARSSQTGTG